MSIYIRVSYDTDEEYKMIRQRLADLHFAIKKAPQKGKYKRAYFNLKTVLQDFTGSEGILEGVPAIDEEYPIT